MGLPPRRDQRCDPGGRAGRHIGRAEIAGVSQQGLGLAEVLRQGVDPAQHRFELLFVIGRLDDVGRDHQQAARRHHGLGVVALLEAAARHRHDAALSVG